MSEQNEDQTSLTQDGLFLHESLKNIEAHERYEESLRAKETLHVSGVGGIFVGAYEQLRNTTENIEDHMLVQAVIMRFYRRNILLTNTTQELGKDLVSELVQAGYFENDSVSLEKIDQLNTRIADFLHVRESLKSRGVASAIADRWTLELLSVQSEQILRSPIRQLSFVHFAHQFFMERIDHDALLATLPGVKTKDLPPLLYIAIHKELLKSDSANARSGLLQLYNITPENLDQFIEFNTLFDKFIMHEAFMELTRFVSKNSAPMHIIKSSYFEKRDDESTLPPLTTPSKTHAYIGAHIEQIYKRTKQNVTQGILKSILFFLITFACIGLLIELPLEILTIGHIQALPLAINLILPILFLIIGVITYRKPSLVNKEALQEYITTLIHKGDSSLPPLKYSNRKKKNYTFEIVFGTTFIIGFYLVIARLTSFSYSIIEILLFVILFSVANFLSYRLTLQYKDIEFIETDQGILSLLRNVIYMPFTFVGKRIVKRSEKFNIAAQILDLAVDLPIKTLLRLVRQWISFLQMKKDDLI